MPDKKEGAKPAPAAGANGAGANGAGANAAGAKPLAVAGAKNGKGFGDLLRPPIVLVLICGVITGALAATYGATKDKIAAAEAAVADEARAAVLPGESFGAPLVSLTGEQVKEAEAVGGAGAYPMVTELYEGENGTGYVATVVAKGFGGDLTVIVGVGPDGRVTGARVASHAETPGLGANSTLPEFYEQFAGKGAGGALTVVKGQALGDSEIAAISGATITSRAVTGAVNKAIEAVAAAQAD